MTTTFLVSALLFILGVIVLTSALIRFRTLGLVFFVGLACLFPFLADTSNWDHWFDWFKRYSVAIPICFWAWVLWLAKNKRPTGSMYRWALRCGPVILFVNVAEVALKQYNAGVIPNAILLALLSLTTPLRWSENNHQHPGFHDWSWTAALTTSLTLVYVLDPGFKNISFGAIAVLWIAFGASLLSRSTYTWFTWRAYTLAILVFQDSMFDNLSNFLYPPLLQPSNRTLLKGSMFEYLLLGITIILVVMVLNDRIRRLLSWKKS